MFSHTYSTKGVFLSFKWNFLYYRWCALPLVLSVGSIKSLTVFFTPSHEEFIHINKILLELFSFPAVSVTPIREVLQSFNLVLPWTLVFSCHPCTGEPRTGPSAADRLHQCCGEVEIPFGFSWEADRMHKICENSQSSRKETKMMLAFSVAFSQKPSFILNTYKVLRNLEGCGVWNCVFQGQQELQTTA